MFIGSIQKFAPYLYAGHYSYWRNLPAYFSAADSLQPGILLNEPCVKIAPSSKKEVGMFLYRHNLEEIKSGYGSSGEAKEKLKPARTTKLPVIQECKTCRARKYRDGSADPGVSFKVPAHIPPEQSFAVITTHEQEHLFREKAKARLEGREVVTQYISYQFAKCPECGRTYVAGGEAVTVTAPARRTDPYTGLFFDVTVGALWKGVTNLVDFYV